MCADEAAHIQKVLDSRSKRFEAFVITISLDRLGVKKELYEKLRFYGLKPIQAS